MAAPSDLKSKAISLYRSGSTKQSYKLLKQYIGKKPGDIEAMGLIAEMYIHKRDFSKAEKYLSVAIETSLKSNVHVKSRFSYLQNLIGLFLITRQPQKGSAACARYLKEWPKDEKPNAEERDCLISLAKYCLQFELYEKGRELWLSCRDFFDSNDAGALEVEGRIALALDGVPGRADAVRILGKAKELDPANFSVACAFAAATRSHDAPQSQKAVRDACKLAPVASCGRLPMQVRHLLVLSNAPRSIENQNTTSLDLHFRENYPSQFCKLKQNRYLFSSAFPEYAEQFHLKALPTVQLIINNLATPEAISTDLRARSNALIGEIDAPILNPMDSMVEMSRSALPSLLSGVDGIRVPKTVLVQRIDESWSEVAKRVEAEFDYPLILRSPSAHQSSSSLLKKDLKNISAKLVANRDDFIELSLAKKWDSFYAIEYFDLKRSANVFRKMRVVFIGDELILHSVAFWDDWMVGGWRAGDRAAQFYRDRPEFWQRGAEAVLDPEEFLGAGVLTSLRALRERIPLDFFGIDFDIDDAGDVAIFEVSAAMIFLPAGSPPPGFELPQAPYDHINAAFERLIEDKTASASKRRSYKR